MAIEDGREFSSALKRVEAAVSAMRTGDPEPFIACWGETPDATVFGALGRNAQGSEAVAETLRQVAAGFTGGDSEVEYLAVSSSGDLAYTVGIERGSQRVRGGPEREMVLRVTHIYQRRASQWRLVHRHADLPNRG